MIFSILQYLIKNELYTNINIRKWSFETPLMTAIIKENVKAVEFLCDQEEIDVFVFCYVRSKVCFVVMFL